MDYIAVAIAPGIAICLYIFYKDVYNKEPHFNLIVSFILGALTVIPAGLINDGYLKTNPFDGSVTQVFIFAYLVVALNEETLKFAALRLYSYNQKSFDEPLDGIVYSLMVSMGFATAENIMYVIKYEELAGQGLKIGLYRMFTAVPAHATFAIVMGYFVGKAKFSKGGSLGLLLTGLLVAVFFHGTYDFFLFLYQFSYVGRDLGEALMFGGAIVSLVVALVLSRKLIKQHHLLSHNTHKEKNSNSSA